MNKQDSSTISLLFSNLAIIILSIIQKWDLSTILWVYWMQSIIIGFFQFFKILSLRTFTAFFFAFHYGFFHFIYAIFLYNFFQNSPGLNFQDLLLGSAIFFVNHFFSFIQNRVQDEKLKPNINTLLFQPYIRIIPMHLVLILGIILGNQSKLIFFLILKTLADLATHIIKNKSLYCFFSWDKFKSIH